MTGYRGPDRGYFQGARVQLDNSYDYGCDTGTVRGYLSRHRVGGTLAVDLDNGLKIGVPEDEVAPHVNTVIALEVYIVADRRSYVAKFATEAQALAFAERKSADDSHYIYELEMYPCPESCPALMDYLRPRCEHGMSAQLCEGPEHFMTREQEIQRFGY